MHSTTLSDGHIEADDYGGLPLSPTQQNDYLKQYSDKAAIELTLQDIANISFKSIDEAEHFYNRYAYEVGFSIRKDKLKVKGDIIIMRSFVCNKAGFRRPKVSHTQNCSTSTLGHRYETRCGCHASFKVRLCEEDMLYHPIQFNNIHNHELVESKYSHFLPSHRNVDELSAYQISELRSAGIKPSQIMHVMVKNRGGFENVGFTRKDLFNHIYSSKSHTEASRECELALQYLQCLARTDPGVYVRVDKDDHNRITKIFFSDTISRSEYSVFGDVVMCDSTYRTNRLRMPLVLMVGVDNHCATIVFACALLTDETKESYTWVYETFVACMGKAPGLIITDGDRAMQASIREVLPKTRHRLCYWHLVRKMGAVCQDPGFNRDLYVVMRKRFSVEIFWQKWSELLQRYGITYKSPQWAVDMNSTAQLWAESYFDGVFTAGLFSNQRAESTNSSLKKNVDVTLTIHKFFQQYFVFLDCLRQISMRNECINSQCFPANLENVQFRSIRTNIAERYTLAVYNKLDRDISKSETYYCHIVNLVKDAPNVHLLAEKYDPIEQKHKSYRLKYHKSDHSFQCECGKFEMNGLPCLHMFAAIKQLGITKLADANMSPRWMKDARKMCNLSSSCTQSITGNGNRMAIIRPHCERLLHLASLGEEHMRMAMEEIEQLSERLGNLHVNEEVGGFNIDGMSNTVEIEPVFGDPPVVRTKGAPSQRVASTARCCSYCFQPGHSRPTCQQRKCTEGVENAKGKKKQRN